MIPFKQKRTYNKKMMNKTINAKNEDKKQESYLHITSGSFIIDFD